MEVEHAAVVLVLAVTAPVVVAVGIVLVVLVVVAGLGRLGNAGWSQQLVGSEYWPLWGAWSKVIAIIPSSSGSMRPGPS